MKTRLKYLCAVILGLLIFSSCKDNPSNHTTTFHNYVGWVFLLDSSGVSQVFSSEGIKVTLIETGAITTTDSTGHYNFNNIPEGIYNFSYEYRDYPKCFLQNVNLSGENGSTINATEAEHISSIPTHIFIIDSTYTALSYSTNQTEPDTNIEIYFTRFSQRPSQLSNWLWIMGKSSNQLDLVSGKYLYSAAWLNSSTNPVTSQHNWMTILYDTLFAYGFKLDDSLCVKMYAINSISHYIDPNTKLKIYPYIGNSSNIIKTVLK